ncbi:LpqB family beta-propeller domain-containing protein [Streptomyces sp. FXJ1.172]|uniref:WD40 repeat domain-containing protein n=1 Tax=Streptomyces sp. FXJ1.172 TaxID=710705 RepID=UPI0007CF3DD4|nr:LpqB family beta-propeller domain-containing protein [Streptomyces sp. FXJ1.172]WEO92973.1 LpqB family beta-propeller domain-containing protein [Streptomyces sp. FXJ1.172]
MSQPGTVALTVPHDGSVQAVAFSPDSARFASGGTDSVLRVRAVGIGAPLDVPSQGFVSAIAFSPDGSAFAVADFEQVFLRNGSTGSAIWQGPLDPGNSVKTVRFCPDGRLVAATDTAVVVLDGATGKTVQRIPVDTPQIADLDLSRDGTRIALAIDQNHGGDHKAAGDARVVELATGAEVGRLTPDNAVLAVAFSPDASLVLCCSADDTTRMFQAGGGAQVWPAKDDVDDQVTAPSCLAFDPKGRWTVVGGADGFARVLEAESGVEMGRAPKLTPGGPNPELGAVTHVAFSPNGKVAASASIDNVVRVFGLDGNEHYTVATDEVLAMEFSPDGRWLGVGCFKRALVIDNGEPGLG